MKRRSKWLIAVVVLLLAGGALLRLQQGRKADTLAAPAAKAPVALELAAADLLTLRNTDIARALEVSGSVVAVNSAFVKARVAGEVKAVTVREGDSVRAGQLLAQLDTTELDWRLRQVDQQAQAARAQLDIAQRTLQNNKALVAQGFISPTALDNAVSTEAGAQATLQAALAAVELARKARADAQVSAPIAGQIAQRLVNPGERVAVDARLLEIVDLAKLELQASVTPEQAGQLRVGAQARLNVDGIDTPVIARVARINPSAQAGSRSVLAYLELQPNAALRQGLFARGSIELDRRTALALPLGALRLDQAQPYALLLQGDTAVRRTLTLGARGLAGGSEVVEVLSGLAEGERVLAGHVGAVRDGTPVRLARADAPASAASR